MLDITDGKVSNAMEHHCTLEIHLLVKMDQVDVDQLAASCLQNVGGQRRECSTGEKNEVGVCCICQMAIEKLENRKKACSIQKLMKIAAKREYLRFYTDNMAPSTCPKTTTWRECWRL